jgi:hypothetical protein
LGYLQQAGAKVLKGRHVRHHYPVDAEVTCRAVSTSSFWRAATWVIRRRRPACIAPTPRQGGHEGGVEAG